MNEALAIDGATTTGERLKLARERAGLTIERVAKDLYLDVHIIQAIEANRFKDIGAPVYAKGYLRKYARMVGMAEEEAVQGYNSSSDAPSTADPIPASMGTVPEPRQFLPRWILWVIVALILIAGLMTLLNLRNAAPEATQSNVISQPLSSPLTDVTPAATSANQATQVPVSDDATGAVALSFKFTGDSWVEVYDSRNQQVLYDMGTTNTSREIRGMPPLRVVLGAASAVTLQVNAQDVTIPANKVDAGVARFVVNAQGELQ